MERKQGPMKVQPNRADACRAPAMAERYAASSSSEVGLQLITCYWQDVDSDFTNSTLCEVDGRAFNLETEFIKLSLSLQ